MNHAYTLGNHEVLAIRQALSAHFDEPPTFVEVVEMLNEKSRPFIRIKTSFDHVIVSLWEEYGTIDFCMEVSELKEASYSEFATEPEQIHA